MLQGYLTVTLLDASGTMIIPCNCLGPIFPTPPTQVTVNKTKAKSVVVNEDTTITVLQGDAVHYRVKETIEEIIEQLKVVGR